MTLSRAWDVAKFLASDPAAHTKIGVTPHSVIHRDGKASVRYFAPANATKDPVFISMPLINTWTIFDLLPGKSVVERTVAAGIPVYLMDWGRPGPEDANVTVADLVQKTLHRSIDRARRHAGRPLQAIGYCVGGTFLAAYIGLHPTAFTKVAFVATPIDFHKSGRLSTWANPETFPVDAIIDNLGNFPSHLMKTSFAWLRPTNTVTKYKTLMDRIDKPGFTEVYSAMEKWNEDSIDFPGEAYREYVRRCYFDNALMTGGWSLDGQPVDLANCKVPVHTIAASADHIVPPEAAHNLSKVWGGPATSQTIKGGHVAICIGTALPDALVAWVTA